MTSSPTSPTSREAILARVRGALRNVPDGERPEDHPVPRAYLSQYADGPDSELIELLADNLTDYRAIVHRTPESGLPALIARLLADRGAQRVAVPQGLPSSWLSASDADQVPDHMGLTARHLDDVPSVVTACALAIAKTGTIVLDAGPGQGRRLLTLVPDHHICVIRVPEQVVASLPQAMPRLDPARPQTWISGPSATSDIELDRVEGVHGPRKLEVVLVTP